MRLALMHPGEMGAAVGAQLVAGGHEVLWLPEGRSAETAARARTAGLTATGTLDGVEMVISICPPHAALEVARSLAGRGSLVVDANAISPATAAAIGAVLGGRWVDGGIVGPPPLRAGTTRLYLSGARATDVASLFAGTLLEAVVLDSSPVAASTLKMVYAAQSKGAAALLLATVLAARAGGVEQALWEEWGRSQPALPARYEVATDSAVRKGWRWEGEMREVARTLSDLGLPGGFHESAAEVFAHWPRPSA